VVDIYSTFLQRSYDQLFQEVSLQDLPVLLLMDRAGVVGPDGPTHHGVFDIAYMRSLPNIVVMAPGDGEDLERMIPWALAHDHPVSIRYPKATVAHVKRGGDGANQSTAAPIELGKSERIMAGSDGTMIACGAVLADCVAAAELLAAEGLHIGVINARFIKPLDAEAICEAVAHSPFVLTLEEGVLMGGFGSAVLEVASDAGLDTSHISRIGIPDRYIEHADRAEQLASVGLSVEGIAARCRELAGGLGALPTTRNRTLALPG
jgi:1-deoxy-D-xylulose-5-phosphate synthase